jgi:hypothetical protein
VIDLLLPPLLLLLLPASLPSSMKDKYIPTAASCAWMIDGGTAGLLLLLRPRRLLFAGSALPAAAAAGVPTEPKSRTAASNACTASAITLLACPLDTNTSESCCP